MPNLSTVEALVNERLSRQWGRPVHPVPSSGEMSPMHQLISAVEESSSDDDECGSSSLSVSAVKTRTVQAQHRETHVYEGFLENISCNNSNDNDDYNSSTGSGVGSANVKHEDSAEVSPSWRAVIERCHTHPHEAAHLDRRGGSCLHAVCSKNPPVAVIAAILKACRRNGETVLERDKSGRTPLMIAISSGARLEVIKALLQSSRRAASVNDHSGNLPLHLASSSCHHRESDQVVLIRLLLKACPEAARRESNDGKTPLQYAIESRSPASIVQLLLKEYPEAVIQDGNGLNPLFLAIRRNAPVDVIRSLVEAHPHATLTRDRGAGLPLRRAIESQSPIAVLECLCTSPSTVLDLDQLNGYSALHGALECGTARAATVDLLVRMAPQIAVTSNMHGKTPLSLACQRYVRSRAHRGVDGSHEELWTIVTILLRAAYYSGCNNGQVHDMADYAHAIHLPVLHAALALPVPHEIALMALTLYPEQASMRGCKKGGVVTGGYLLWTAIQDHPSSFVCSDSFAAPHACVTSYRRGVALKEDIILRLFDIYPEAATLPDNDGRYALSMAAEADGIRMNVLNRLWKANPEAGRKLDPVHRLYPFQVAALPKRQRRERQQHRHQQQHQRSYITTHPLSGSNARTGAFASFSSAIPAPKNTSSYIDPRQEEEDLNQLTTIFTLLLAEPSVLQLT